MSTNISGSLTLILGPMCSGKSTKNIELLAKHSDAITTHLGGAVPLYITHQSDMERVKKNGGDDIVFSHASRFKGLSVNIDKVSTSKLSEVDVTKREVIGIDEAQFFEDLVPTIKRWLTEGKQITCSALNGDFNMKSFGDVKELISSADNIIFKRAICYYCIRQFPSHERTLHTNDIHSMKAAFTAKISGDHSKQIEVEDATEKYKPVCRRHFDELETARLQSGNDN